MMSSVDRLVYWFVFQNSRLLIHKATAMKVLDSSSLLNLHGTFTHQYLLAHFEEFDIYCAEMTGDLTLPDDIDAVPMRKALELLGPDWYTVAAKAYSIINWDKNHQYCGHCGNVTVYKPGASFERICPVCSLSFYPRISPSVIVLISRGDEILMARSPHFTPGTYGLIAGFVEAGESVEETLHREVREEVGISIRNLRYFGSQAWPFPDSLMIGFFAEHAGGEIVINTNEIEEAGWYHYNQLPGRPSVSISIAYKLIDAFIAEKKGLSYGTSR